MSSSDDSPDEELPLHIFPKSDPLFSLKHNLETEGCPYSLDLTIQDSNQVSPSRLWMPFSSAIFYP